MAFWKPNEPLQLGSTFHDINVSTGRIVRRPGSAKRLSSVFDLNPFLRELPKELRNNLRETMRTSRAYGRGTELRGVGVGGTVHIVLSGCVRECTTPPASTVRILGAGAVLGCTEVFDERIPAPLTTCLTETWTLCLPLERLRAMAEANSALLKAIGVSVTDRMEASERIYNRLAYKSEQRLAGLLAHLLMHCAVPGKRYDFMIEGPTQHDLAAALSLSIGSVEGGLASLRRDNIVITGYRTFEFPSVRRLLEASQIKFPPGSLAGTLTSFQAP
ncbi:cyclic nucleotide-binding domain-containing protein [Streptomyces sp. PvR034]|uniref:Crp/Fnr family transcriptional regulator n=1 Tax=Streptomyces sp. PvR034 TaxID=3156401 RepID=UPI003397CC80